MTFELRDLGPYRVERTEDWNNGIDNSYAAMIRVKGSNPVPPYFMVPSHLYKYSDSELALYLKDHKNLWRKLGKLLNEEIEISDTEIVLRFPISLFEKVSGIVPFVKKRSRKTPLTDQERERASHLRSLRKDIMKRNEPKSSIERVSQPDTPMTLDAFVPGGSR